MRALACLMFVACSSLGPSPQEILDRSVFTYNQHLRWKRFDKAASFVDKPGRDAFTKVFEGSEETLSIDDLELKSIDYENDKRAKVVIEARYFKLPSVTLQKAKWVQVWERREDDWWLIEQARGPFFPEPASAPASAPAPTH
jgi:hypothetical protein